MATIDLMVNVYSLHITVHISKDVLFNLSA